MNTQKNCSSPGWIFVFATISKTIVSRIFCPVPALWVWQFIIFNSNSANRCGFPETTTMPRKFPIFACNHFCWGSIFKPEKNHHSPEKIFGWCHCCRMDQEVNKATRGNYESRKSSRRKKLTSKNTLVFVNKIDQRNKTQEGGKQHRAFSDGEQSVKSFTNAWNSEFSTLEVFFLILVWSSRPRVRD